MPRAWPSHTVPQGVITHLWIVLEGVNGQRTLAIAGIAVNALPADLQPHNNVDLFAQTASGQITLACRLGAMLHQHRSQGTWDVCQINDTPTNRSHIILCRDSHSFCPALQHTWTAPPCGAPAATPFRRRRGPSARTKSRAWRPPDNTAQWGVTTRLSPRHKHEPRIQSTKTITGTITTLNRSRRCQR